MWIQALLQKPVVRFCVAGSVGYVTFYTLLYVLTEYFHVWYLTSSMSAIVVNYTITFLLQKLWTFRDKTTHVVGRQVALYAMMVTTFYFSNAVLLYLFVEYLGLWYMLAQAIISVLLTIVSFLISRRLFTPTPPTV